MKRFNPLVLLFFICCSVTEPPFQHRYVIELLLKPDLKFQKAFVDSTYRLDISLEEISKGVRGAEIFVVDKNLDTFRYVESDTLDGLYQSIDSSFVKYEEKYEINIKVGKEVIFKEIQVPGKIKILSPNSLDTISLSNPQPLIWNKCKYCFKNFYIIIPYLRGKLKGENNEGILPIVTTDTTINIFSNRILFKEKDTLYTILVEGMDSNSYMGYLGPGYGELKNDKVIGLVGAVVFDTIAVWIKN
ncbi:MAG: hypothetical protein ABIN61_08350 [candidate division WOR-3 bacterium]